MTRNWGLALLLPYVVCLTQRFRGHCAWYLCTTDLWEASILTTITMSGPVLYSKDYKMFGKNTDMPHCLESQSGQQTQETESHGKWCRVIVATPLLIGLPHCCLECQCWSLPHLICFQVWGFWLTCKKLISLKGFVTFNVLWKDSILVDFIPPQLLFMQIFDLLRFCFVVKN